jgi:MoaA/NifB/PqqE/SkfB family radical SAM enzyme
MKKAADNYKYKAIWFIIKKSFTLRRFWNLIINSLSYLLSIIFKKVIIWGYPHALMIEPTNFCNLQCPLCPSGIDLLTRERGYMSLEMFKEVVDSIYKHTYMLILWNQGEPFLHKDIVEMIKYATEKKLFTMLSTNANVMPAANELIEAGLDFLIISIDGTTQETYDKYRKNGSIEKVKTNLSVLIKTKKEMKSKTPITAMQFIIMKHNQHEIEDIKTLANQLETDILAFKTLQIYNNEDIEKYLPTDEKHRRYYIDKDKEQQFQIPVFKNRCYRIWAQPVINWNGEMSVCCFDKDAIFKIGNIKTTSFHKLFHSENFNKFRQTVLKDRKKINICCNCGEGAPLNVTKQEY